MKKLFTLIALMAVSTVFAQNVTVTFRVDLGAQVFKGFYVPASDSITVRGSFQENSANGAATGLAGTSKWLMLMLIRYIPLMLLFLLHSRAPTTNLNS